MCRVAPGLCFAILLLTGQAAAAQIPAPAPSPALHPVPANDIHEAVRRVPVTAMDRLGKEYAADILVTTYKPQGDGPFPLVIINHGRAENPRERAAIPRFRYSFAARYFVRKGFAVAVPSRIGYADTVGVGDPDNRGWGCVDSRGLVESGIRQIRAVTTHLRREPWIAPDRLLLVGESVGGYITIQANSSGIPGLFAGINFSGGSNGHPEAHPGKPCGIPEMLATTTRQARKGGPPMLWLYSANDRFFGPAFAQALHRAFQRGGGRAELHVLPPLGEDAKNEGHNLFGLANDTWQPMADSFLARFGYTVPGAIRPIASSGYAALDDEAALPHVVNPRRREVYREFLKMPSPRALAISPQHSAATQGDDAPSRALAFCQARSTDRCRLYAVDEAVVW